MDFSKALDAMKEGQKVKKSSWNDTYIIFGTPDRFYRVHTNGLKEDWYFGNNDILTEDWEIVEDSPEVKPQCRYYVIYPSCEREFRIRSGAEDFICGRCSKNWKIDKTNTSLNVDIEILTKYKEWLQKMIKDYDTQIQVYLKDKKYERAGSFDRSRDTFKTCLCMLERLEGD